MRSRGTRATIALLAVTFAAACGAVAEPDTGPGSSGGGSSSGSHGSSGGGGSSSSGASGGSSSGGAPLDGAALYGARCARCHGALATSSCRGASASRILLMHGDLVNQAEAAAIATALSSVP